MWERVLTSFSSTAAAHTFLCKELDVIAKLSLPQLSAYTRESESDVKDKLMCSCLECFSEWKPRFSKIIYRICSIFYAYLYKFLSKNLANWKQRGIFVKFARNVFSLNISAVCFRVAVSSALLCSVCLPYIRQAWKKVRRKNTCSYFRLSALFLRFF